MADYDIQTRLGVHPGVPTCMRCGIKGPTPAGDRMYGRWKGGWYHVGECLNKASGYQTTPMNQLTLDGRLEAAIEAGGPVSRDLALEALTELRRVRSLSFWQGGQMQALVEARRELRALVRKRLA